jgi:hypothetical protein
VCPRLKECITYVDAPIYFRQEPRPADGGMPRFDTEAEARDAHEQGMAAHRAGEQYAATSR